MTESETDPAPPTPPKPEPDPPKAEQKMTTALSKYFDSPDPNKTGRTDDEVAQIQVIISEDHREKLQGKELAKIRTMAVAPLQPMFSENQVIFEIQDKSYLMSNHDLIEQNLGLKRRLQEYSMYNVFLIIKPNDFGQVDPTQDAQSLFDVHTIPTADEVRKSNELYVRFSKDKLSVENLRWTEELILNSCDTTLRVKLSNQLRHIPSSERGGPLAYHQLRELILDLDPKVARQLLDQVSQCKLSDFPNEDPTTYASVINSALFRLEFAQVPVYAIENTVLDAMCQCTVSEFAQHFRTLRTVQSDIIELKDRIFKEAELQFNLMQKNKRWHSTKKQGSSFQAGGYNIDKGGEEDPQEPPFTPSGLTASTQGKKDDKGRFTHDRRGNKIDYNPPQSGQSHSRKNPQTQEQEEWCAKCPNPRWGNHSTAKHDEWDTQRKEAKQKWRDRKKKKDEEDNQDDQEDANTDTNNGQCVRFNVTHSLASSTAAQITSFGTSSPF